MKLDDYRKKRNPDATNEPFGVPLPDREGSTTAGAFVIHQHDASRMHYDLRLEVGGVLASFAVPRGPSLDPADKRLAVRTEDHPIEYLDFEAVIPEGQYGAGAMILWDRGRVRYLGGSAEEGISKGKIDIELQGHKVVGRFELILLKDKKPDRAVRAGEREVHNEWLFFKKADSFVRAGSNIVAEKPRSVLSGLTVDELARAPQIAAAIEQHAAELGAPTGDVFAKPFPPMLCATSGAPEADPGWIYELKIDGVRTIATKTEERIRLVSRTLRETTAAYPEIARAVGALVADRVVLDGEIAAFGANGQPDFQRLGQRIHLSRASDVRRAMVDVPVVFLVFDLLAIGRRDLRGLPLLKRKELLKQLVPAPGTLRVLDHLDGDGRPLLAFCKAHHLEGIVAKRKDARYTSGPKRGDAWVKTKIERDEDFIVIGYTRGENARNRLGALELATFAGDKLVYRGKVGSGLDEKSIDRLVERLAPLTVDGPVAGGTYGSAPRGRTHVRPEIIVRVRFLGFSDDGNARFPVFLGERDDVALTDCTAGPRADAETVAASAPPTPPPSESSEPSEPRPSQRLVVPITNRAKVLFPEDGYTKQDLFNYYDAIAETMLPYLKDRPVMLVRYPDGIYGKSFYQWNVPTGIPSWIRTCRILKEESDKKETEVFLLEEPRGLLYVANLAAIPIHLLAGRYQNLAACDFLTIDLDVERASLDAGVTLAQTLHETLDAIGLDGYAKTSGQSGLHVFVPLGPKVNYGTAQGLAIVLGRLLVKRHPELATMERVIAKRGPRVYVDTGQTGPTRTIVAPYSVRAQKGATVSTPLAWNEVVHGLDPSQFSIRTVPARAAERGDPMAGLLVASPDLPRAIALLEPMMR